jgi:hypothetical protein
MTVASRATSSDGTAPTTWTTLGVNYNPDGTADALVNNQVVAKSTIASVTSIHSGMFAYLAASWSAPTGAGGTTAHASNAEFKSVQINITAFVPPPPAPPAPPSPPNPSPPPPGPTPPGPAGHGLVVASCQAADQQQMWTFSGEDGGEAGTLGASSNVSLCLDVSAYMKKPVLLAPCTNPAVASQMWDFSSQTNQLSSK